MKVYYNEIDKKRCAWLRQLMADDLIPKGDVDDRCIKTIKPSELRGYGQLHFFAGIGGWAYALRLAGWPEDQPIITGSCPCQPFSVAGKRNGTDDERHLWPAFRWIIAQLRIPTCAGEQVAIADGRRWLAGVRADLEALGYAVGAADLCAASVGAPHIRQRLFWMGHAIVTGSSGLTGDGAARCEPGRFRADAVGPDAKAGHTMLEAASVDEVPMLRGLPMYDSRGTCLRLRVPADRRMAGKSLRHWEQFEQLPCEDGWRRVQPGSFPLAHGLPARVVRISGYGDAIVPQVAAEFVTASVEAMSL